MADLDRLLRPKSIAVIGGGTWCENVIRACRSFGFDGALWAVHPSKQQIADCPAFASVKDLPEPPDAVFVGVNRRATVGIVGELAKRGAGGAVCFASGFSEAAAELTDGGSLQADLAAAAADMPILGPNCYGLLNALDRTALWPDQHGLVPVTSGVAIIAQSSNIALNLTMQARGLPIAYLVTVGNQAQTGLSEIGDALLDDDRITAIGLHIEGLDDLAAFQAFARKARAKKKPVVVLKVGRSQQAQAAALSHTASLAGSAAGASALFRRLGLAEVRSLPALLETLKLLHVHGPLPSSRIASLSCSGGEASLIADLGTDYGLSFPALNENQISGLRDALGDHVALANPLDYHTFIWGDTDAMTAAFSAMLQGDQAISLVALDFPRGDRCLQDEWHKVVDALEAASARTGKPVAVVSTLGETMPETIADDMVRRRIVPFKGICEAMEAIAAANVPIPSHLEDVYPPATILNPRLYHEDEAKSALSGFGVPAPRSALAGTPSEAAEKAQEIGFPVVLKGRGIAHKTEAGAVALGLKNMDAVAERADKMPTGSFLVEEMVTGTLTELLVGVVRDPAHGYVLTLAAGGTLTEILKDSVSLIVPASREDIRSALGRLKLAPVLYGYRGKPACDLDSIVDAIMAVQAYVQSAPVEEVEINPLLCGPDFAVAADALIKAGDQCDR